MMRVIEKFKRTVLWDTDEYCVVGSGPMVACGLKPFRDLDYLHYDDSLNIEGIDKVDSHNHIQEYYMDKNEVIFDPHLHFYFFGVKFAALDVIENMKINRNEIPKDTNDIRLIHNFMKGM
jgi:hypothetical protein